MAMTTSKQVNYTPAQVAELVQLYEAGERVEALAEHFNKSTRSIIAKLVREGVYVAAEKPKARKIEGPSKKEMLLHLERLVSFDVNGLMGATKEAIAALIVHFEAQRAEQSDESESEAA
jgi:hypothetical protein